MKTGRLPLPSADCLPEFYEAVIAGRLVKDFSHQIGNCLFGILGYTEVLLSKMSDGDPLKRRAMAVEQKALTLKRLVDALVELPAGKGEASGINDIALLVRNVVMLLQDTAVKAGVSIKEDYQEVSQQVLDGSRLRQAVYHLLQFSITSAAVDSVKVATQRQDGLSMVIISGAAMKTEGGPSLEALTEETERLSMENLPLYFSRLKVEELGGRLESTAEMGMVTFTITLPPSY